MKLTGKLVGWVLLAAGCAKRESALEGESDQAAAAEQALGDRACKAWRQPAHQEALPLAVEFLQRETHGNLLRGGAWLNTALLCPGRDGPLNHYSVITRYDLKTKSISPDRAEFEVAYQVVGEVLPVNDSRGSRLAYVPQTERKILSLVLRHTSFGWRLEGPLAARGLFVLPEAAIKASGKQLSSKDRAVLTELL